MDNPVNETIFLVTGLITAAAANEDHPTLKLARSLVEEEQYIAAIYTAEQIIRHYPDTTYARAADDLIDTIRSDYLKKSHRLN